VLTECKLTSCSEAETYTFSVLYSNYLSSDTVDMHNASQDLSLQTRHAAESMSHSDETILGSQASPADCSIACVQAHITITSIIAVQSSYLLVKHAAAYPGKIEVYSNTQYGQASELMHTKKA